MNMLKWLRTREPQPGRDCSVTLPTTATTNQFIQDPDEHDKLQKLFDDVCDQRRDALAEVECLRERIKELEAEVRRDRETNSGYAKDLAVLLDASLASESDAERLRKAIEEALHAQQHRGLKVAREILKAALSPSPAAENKSNGSQSPHKPATRPQANEAEPAAATEAIVSATASDPASERIKELEAEVERLTELYQEDTVTTWDQKQEVERLRKAIETAGDHIARAEFAKAQFVLVDALSPSPAAASGENNQTGENHEASQNESTGHCPVVPTPAVGNEIGQSCGQSDLSRVPATGSANHDPRRLGNVGSPTIKEVAEPSPAAASGETTEQAEPKRAVNPPRTSRQTDAAESAGDAPPKILTSAPASESEGNAQHHIEGAKIPEGGSGSSAAESEGTACSDRGVHAQELPPEEDIIHWNTDWRTAVPGGGNSGVIQQPQPELADLRLRLETCEERLGYTESERDAAIAKCHAAEEKIAAWRRLIHEQRARIVALEKEKGFPSRFGDEPMFDVNHVENRVVPPEFLLSKVAKDWVVDPHITDSTKLGGRRGFLKLGLRARRALRQLNVHTVGQLMQLTSPEIKSVSGVGGMTLHEIKKALAACDLYLLDDIRRK